MTLSVTLDRALVDWLDIEDVRMKHRTGAGKASKAEVLAALIRDAMERRP